MTERCPAGCVGCYADATASGHEPTFEEIAARLDELAALGVFSVAFGGGEASLRDDIGDLARHARSVGLAPTMTTSGLGISAKRAREMTAFAQVNVSWDGPDEVYRAVRGWDGAGAAEKAVGHLRAAGIVVGINTVLTRATFSRLDDIAAGVAAMGAVELQLLRFKPSGRGRLDYLATRLSAEQVDAFGATLRRLANDQAPAIRIDCALLPFLAGSGETRPQDLARFGVMGCEAGRSLMTLDAHGATSPCSFWSGQLDDRSPSRTWNDAPVLTRFRDYVAALPEPCASCEYQVACRGGCRVVADHSGDAFSPDPECPRVRALSEAGTRSASSAVVRDD